MIDTDPILEIVEEFLAATGISPSRFGTIALGDPGFVFDLRSGREVRRATRDRVIQHIETA